MITTDYKKANHMNQQKSDLSVSKVAMNLEVHVIPVSDVERSKEFYQRLGWRLDEDVAPAKNVRIVQFTPPGSGCSVNFGNGVTASAPGTAVGARIVSDIKTAHEEVTRRGIGASGMWHGAPFPPEARLPGPDPKRASYGSFFAFADPDGNAWLVQEVTTRRPAADRTSASTGRNLYERETCKSGCSEYFRRPHQSPRCAQARRRGDGSIAPAAHVSKQAT
jgi:catechol 2,3-dioxygenase-like lactoylglutathione lyase family enzyme